MTIRKMETQDVEAVHALLGYIPNMPVPSIEAFRKAVCKRGYPDVIVAADEKGGTVMGVAIYQTQTGYFGQPYVFLYCLSVDPEHRRQGVATALVGEIEKLMKRKKPLGMEWLVYKENKGAIKFYRNIGAEYDDDFAIMSVPF